MSSIRRPLLLAALCALLPACTSTRPDSGPAAGAPSAAAAGGQHLSGPFTHENLTIWLVHGADRLPNARYLTLQEGLDAKLVVVQETGNVNELTIENLSPDDEVFIQAGDIVRGGKQDRCIGVDFVVPKKSGKMPVAAFCVEHGRWQRRGTENADSFAKSDKMVAGRAMKLQVQGQANQSGVWQQVGENQQALSANLGGEVRARESASSFQLTLENAKVQAAVKAYTDALSKAAAGQRNTIGLIFAVNGELNNADVYGAHGLFAKLWPKLLESAAVEALAAKKPGPAAHPPTLAAVQTFLNSAADSPAKSRRVSARIDYQSAEAPEIMRFRLMDAAQPASVHENVIRK